MDTQETPFRWEATETQFMPRVLICLRFSDLEGEVKGWLDRDLRDVALGIKMATEDLGTQWDSVVSSKEFTVPEFAPRRARSNDDGSSGVSWTRTAAPRTTATA